MSEAVSWEGEDEPMVPVDLAVEVTMETLYNAPENLLQEGLGFRQVGWFDPVFGELWSMAAVEQMTAIDKHFLQPVWTKGEGRE